MMKKGFTLAEVLITLTIIGVVAVLTLPGLMTNTAEQQARTALKKMTNTFSQAAEMNGAIAGYNYSGVSSSATITNEEKPFDDMTDGSLLRIFGERLNVEKSKGIDAPTLTITSIKNAVYLKDGTAIYFENRKASDDELTPQDDGLMKGIPVLFDTNSAKSPNKISTCTKAKLSVTAFGDDDAGDCSEQSNRFIKDIFMMRLRDASVYPIGAASTWMMDDKEVTASKLNEYNSTSSGS